MIGVRISRLLRAGYRLLQEMTGYSPEIVIVFSRLLSDHLLKSPQELVCEILYDYVLLCSDHLLNASSR